MGLTRAWTRNYEFTTGWGFKYLLKILLPLFLLILVKTVTQYESFVFYVLGGWWRSPEPLTAPAERWRSAGTINAAVSMQSCPLIDGFPPAIAGGSIHLIFHYSLFILLHHLIIRVNLPLLLALLAGARGIGSGSRTPHSRACARLLSGSLRLLLPREVIHPG